MPRQLAFDDPRSVWLPVRDGDMTVRDIFDNHYSRRNDKTRFVGPGERMVLRTAAADAIFIWRLERFRQDRQEGVCCAVFRNESAHLSSDLILAADALAWERWPNSRLFTFVDANKIKSTNPGFCFQ